MNKKEKRTTKPSEGKMQIPKELLESGRVVEVNGQYFLIVDVAGKLRRTPITA